MNNEYKSSSPSSSLNANNANNNYYYASIFLILLTIENTLSMLCRRYAVGVLHLEFSKNSVLCVNEIIKMVFSIQMKKKKFISSSGREEKMNHVRFLVKESYSIAPIAVIYLIVNLISYPSLQRVDASVFTAISNLKVLATALFASVLLNTKISQRVWRTLAQLVLGVTLISWESTPNNPVIHKRVHQQWYEHVTDMFDLEYAFGVFLALVQTFLSGFASVYFELKLKNKSSSSSSSNIDDNNNNNNNNNNNDLLAIQNKLISLDVWDRNIQLSLCSILIYMPISVYETNGKIFEGWTMLVVLISILHASGGILVALAVLYSSSVTKTVAVCLALVCTTIFGHILFYEPLNGPILLGCAMVIISVWTYKDDNIIEAKMRKAGLF